MSRTRVLAVAACLLAAGVASGAGATSSDRATGGGQILVSTDGGAGDTIAFTARNTGDDDTAKGEVQYVDRTGGTGQGQVVVHGDVTCLQVNGNTAKLAGNFRDGTSFTMVVVDNGEGAAASDDMIALQRVDDPTCERDDEDDDGSTALARGNAQVYDAP